MMMSSVICFSRPAWKWVGRGPSSAEARQDGFDGNFSFLIFLCQSCRSGYNDVNDGEGRENNGQSAQG